MSGSPDWALFFGRFHPVLVHLPIGLIVLLAAMEAVALFKRFERVNASAGFILCLAVPGSIAAALCGWLLSRAGGYDARLLDLHFWTGVATAGSAALAGVLYAAKLKPLYRLTIFGSFGVLVVASHYGGSLTHGSDYLLRYAPPQLRSWFQGGSRTPPERVVEPEMTSTAPLAPSAFTAVVHPILDQYCIACHGPEKSKGSLRLDTFDELMKGGTSGAAVVAGDSGASLLIERMLLPMDSDEHMPPDGKPQPTREEIALLRWWIDAGTPKETPVAAMKTNPKTAEILARRLGATEAAVVVPAKPETLDRAEAIKLAEALSTELRVPITALSENEGWLQANASIAGQDFKDEQLAKLEPVAANLRWLDLGGTGVTDAGLQNLSKMKNLTRLHLQRTSVTDDGLRALPALSELEYLNLYGSQISDQGLAALKDLPKLRQLYVWQTQVTSSNALAFAEAQTDRDQIRHWEAEIETLKQRVRDAHVNVFLGVDTQQKAETAFSGIVNTLCPVSAKPVDPKRTSTYEGHLVGFCCADCKATFDKDPKPHLARLELTTPDSKPVNAECPVSGKSVNPECTVIHEGKRVAFCCADCRAAFEKDPQAYAAKVAPTTRSVATNQLCPVSGKPVSAEQFAEFEGKRVAFCCADCKATFLKDPKAYAGKLAQAAKGEAGK